MRRAQGIGINIVIIAAIALLVLLVVAMIVTQSGGDVRATLDSCQVQGGECVQVGDAPPEDMMRSEQYACPENMVCYVPA